MRVGDSGDLGRAYPYAAVINCADTARKRCERCARRRGHCRPRDVGPLPLKRRRDISVARGFGGIDRPTGHNVVADVGIHLRRGKNLPRCK